MSSFGENRWRHVWDLPKSECSGRFIFVTDETIAYVCKDVWLLSTDGQVVFRDPLEKGEALGFSNKFAVSQEGKVFAFVATIAHDFWDTGVHVSAMHIVVYNSKIKSRTLTIDINPIPKNDFDFALSPDGSRLAVLSDRSVLLYPIPVS